MDLITYTFMGFVYIMIMHFAIGIKNDFNIYIMVTIFVIGAAMGAFLDNYIFGFAASIVLSLILW